MRWVQSTLLSALMGAALLLAGCGTQDPYVHAAHQASPAERTGGAREVPDWLNGVPNMKVPEHPSRQR
jgi:hypothetical protein